MRRKAWQRHGKSEQRKLVGVEIRAGGDLYGPERPGWSAGDIEKQHVNKNPWWVKTANNQPTSQKPPQDFLKSQMQEFYRALKIH